jgi:hypothetical protein
MQTLGGEPLIEGVAQLPCHALGGGVIKAALGKHGNFRRSGICDQCFRVNHGCANLIGIQNLEVHSSLSEDACVHIDAVADERNCVAGALKYRKDEPESRRQDSGELSSTKDGADAAVRNALQCVTADQKREYQADGGCKFHLNQYDAVEMSRELSKVWAKNM